LIFAFSLFCPPINNVFAEDWIVTETEFVENDTVLLDRDLIVENGGDLTLRSVTLTMNNTYNGEFGIRVKSGGAIAIESGTRITAASGSARFSFAVDAGAIFVMSDSELHGCG